MSFYFVAPFEGQLTDGLSVFTAIEKSDFTIDIGIYRSRLEEYWMPKWPQMLIGGPDKNSVLAWELYYDPDSVYSGHGKILKDEKSLSLDVFHPDFILWHRTVIPDRYRLVLYADSSPKYLVFTPDTSWDEAMHWWETMHEL